MNVQECKNELVMRGTIEWVSLAELIGFVGEYSHGLTDDDMRQLVMTTLSEILEQGLMEIGNSLDGFQNLDMSNQEILEIIRKKWDTCDPSEYWKDSFWLQNTAKGNEIGAEVIRNIQSCINALLMRGLDGLLHASDIATIAIEVGGMTTLYGVRWLSLEMIHRVVAFDLMKIGDIMKVGCDLKSDFTPWKILLSDPEERVDSEWRSLGRNPNPGEICCLRITDKGREMAEELKRQKGNEP